MLYLLYGLFLLACVVLIVAVLLQPGKADAGALFTSSISSTAFGARGTQTLLAKITIGAAAAFMLLALTLSLPGITGSRSVVQEGDSEETTVPMPQPQQQQSAPGTTAPPQDQSAPPAGDAAAQPSPQASPAGNR